MAILKYESENELYHHGIKGMKWGVRRFQNYDGSYTQSGMKRYNRNMGNYEKTHGKQLSTKAAYKKGYVDKATYKKSKRATKLAKRQLSDSYDDLSVYKMTDKYTKEFRDGKGKYTKQSVKEFDKTFKEYDQIRRQKKDLQRNYWKGKVPEALYQRKMDRITDAENDLLSKFESMENSRRIDSGRQTERDLAAKGSSHLKETVKEQAALAAFDVGVNLAAEYAKSKGIGVESGRTDSFRDSLKEGANNVASNSRAERAANLKASSKQRVEEQMDRYEYLENKLRRTKDPKERAKMKSEMSKLSKQMIDDEYDQIWLK